MSKLEKLDEPKTSQPSQGSKSSRKKGALRLETKHLSMLQEEKKQNDNSEIKEERKVSMIDLNNRKSIDYDHTLSPTTKIKIKAEIFIHLKQGTIDENYSIGELLGEGAYGKVNVATHKLSGILRALKTIKKQDLPKEDEAKLFSEMNLLKTIDHPNIIKLIELFQDDKYYYLITELKYQYIFSLFF